MALAPKSNSARSKYLPDQADGSEDEKSENNNNLSPMPNNNAGVTSAIKEMTETNEKMFRKFRKQVLRSNKIKK